MRRDALDYALAVLKWLMVALAICCSALLLLAVIAAGIAGIVYGITMLGDVG